MEQPLVTIFTITRNRGNLIGRCIDSVLGQTYKNIEHIVVDGASEDNTDIVISKYDDQRLKFIKLDSNWPLKETMDYAISLCEGEFFTFLDSDDEYLPTKIEKQVALIQSLPEDYGMVYCGMTEINSATGEVINRHIPSLRGMVYDEAIGVQHLSGTPTFLFKRPVFEKLGGWRYDVGITSDWELAVRCCREYKVDYVPEELVRVYVNHGSVRQSDDAYYSNLLERRVTFNRYFLSEFHDVFQRHPDYAAEFYYSLCLSLFPLKRYKEGFEAYRNLLKSSIKFKYLVAPVRALL